MADNNTRIVITAEDRASLALKAVSAQFDGLMSGAGKIAGAFGALTGLSFGGIAASMGAMVHSTANAQDEMGKLAQKAGMTVEAFSGLSYAAKLAGADSDTLVKASKALSQNIVEAARAGDQSKTTFGAMGVAVKDAAGQLRATDQVLLDVAGKFAGMEDGANKSALAVKLFGKSGLELIPFLNQGKDGIRDLTKEAERLGVVVSGDAAKASEKFNDNLERMAQAAEGLKRSIGNAALPVMNEFIQQMTDASTKADSFAGSLRSVFDPTKIEAFAYATSKTTAIVADGFTAIGVAGETALRTVATPLMQIVKLLQFDLKGALDIGNYYISNWTGKQFDYTSTRKKVDAWFDEYQRTVRVNGVKILADTEEHAKQAQKIYDDYYESLAKKSGKYQEFDAAKLQKMDDVRKKYGDEEKRRAIGDIEFAKEKIREKYEAELAAIRGAKDEAVLAAEIRRKMNYEVDSITSESLAKRASAEEQILPVVASVANQRIGIERAAADEVAAVWNEANRVKAGATGGVIANQGTPGEFVSSWDKNGNYVGDLGRTVSGGGSLNNMYSSDGQRKLTIQEAISALNGFAHFATGGQFMVGGSGGTDSQLVQFMASPDERVTVETPAQQRSGGSVTVNVNVSGGNPQSIIAAIKQALRTDPNLFGNGMARAG